MMMLMMLMMMMMTIIIIIIIIIIITIIIIMSNVPYESATGIKGNCILLLCLLVYVVLCTFVSS